MNTLKVFCLCIIGALLLVAQSAHGSITVVSAGTPVAFSAVSKKVNGLYIRVKTSNSGANIYLKGTKTDTPGATGVPLGKGDVAYFEFMDLSQLLLDADSSGDGVDYYHKGNNAN